MLYNLNPCQKSLIHLWEPKSNKNKILTLQKCAFGLMFFGNFYENGYLYWFVVHNVQTKISRKLLLCLNFLFLTFNCFIQTALIIYDTGWGEGEGVLIERGSLLTFLLWKGGDLLEREGFTVRPTKKCFKSLTNDTVEPRLRVISLNGYLVITAIFCPREAPIRFLIRKAC